MSYADFSLRQNMEARESTNPEVWTKNFALFKKA
jgi:hypothetical protein|tara:strand:+ start:6311 stop:6412 length:102 start_codon:yes stop_codon:yes gene_type:complete